MIKSEMNIKTEDKILARNLIINFFANMGVPLRRGLDPAV